MKALVFTATLTLAKFGSNFLTALDDQPKAYFQQAFADDTLQNTRKASTEIYIACENELRSNLQHLPPENIKDYIIGIEKEFYHHKQFFPHIKRLKLFLERDNTLPATELAWRRIYEILDNDSPSLTTQEKVEIICCYCISSGVAEYCNLALEILRRQTLLVPDNKRVSIDSWDTVLVKGFTLSKLKSILTVLPLPLLDEEGSLTEHELCWKAEI